MTGTSVLIAFAALCIATIAGADTCLRITGTCIADACPWGGSSCIDDVCCITDAAENCDDVLDSDFCWENVAKCTDATFKDTMSKQCAKTCKTCDQQSGSTLGGDCVDTLVNCIKDVYKCHNPSLAFTEQNQTVPSILPQTPISATIPPTTT